MYKDTVNSTNVGGQIKRKNDLIAQQKNSYIRDSEQKAAKIYADIWNVTRSTDSTEPAYALGKKQVNFDKVMQKLSQGINASWTEPQDP